MERFFVICATIKVIAVEIMGVLLFLAAIILLGYIEVVHLIHALGTSLSG